MTKLHMLHTRIAQVGNFFLVFLPLSSTGVCASGSAGCSRRRGRPLVTKAPALPEGLPSWAPFSIHGWQVVFSEISVFLEAQQSPAVHGSTVRVESVVAWGAWTTWPVPLAAQQGWLKAPHNCIVPERVMWPGVCRGQAPGHALSGSALLVLVSAWERARLHNNGCSNHASALALFSCISRHFLPG
jgi:hypothetical protein